MQSIVYVDPSPPPFAVTETIHFHLSNKSCWRFSQLSTSLFSLVLIIYAPIMGEVGVYGWNGKTSM